jgi:hypothetical protein
LAILSGLSFLAVGMFLPLVGKAGYVTPHATKNAIAFFLILLVSGLLALLALLAKLDRRAVDGSPFPVLSLGLLVVNAFLMVAFLLGLLHW